MEETYKKKYSAFRQRDQHISSESVSIRASVGGKKGSHLKARRSLLHIHSGFERRNRRRHSYIHLSLHRKLTVWMWGRFQEGTLYLHNSG